MESKKFAHGSSPQEQEKNFNNLGVDLERIGQEGESFVVALRRRAGTDEEDAQRLPMAEEELAKMKMALELAKDSDKSSYSGQSNYYKYLGEALVALSGIMDSIG